MSLLDEGKLFVSYFFHIYGLCQLLCNSILTFVRNIIALQMCFNVEHTDGNHTKYLFMLTSILTFQCKTLFVILYRPGCYFPCYTLYQLLLTTLLATLIFGRYFLASFCVSFNSQWTCQRYFSCSLKMVVMVTGLVPVHTQRIESMYCIRLNSKFLKGPREDRESVHAQMRSCVNTRDY